MLQIIGWLLCVYLVVKGFELIAMKHVSAYGGACLAFFAAPIFFYMINAQSAATSQPMEQLGASFPTDPTAIDTEIERALDEANDALAK